MVTITVEEFASNIDKYLKLSKIEDIYITDKGKIISKLTSPHTDKIEKAKKLFGCISSDVDADAILSERLKKI